MRKLCVNCCAGLLVPAMSLQGAAMEGPGILERSTPGPLAITFLAFGLGLLIFLSVPRNFGEAFVSELKHRLQRWIAHV